MTKTLSKSCSNTSAEDLLNHILKHSLSISKVEIPYCTFTCPYDELRDPNNTLDKSFTTWLEELSKINNALQDNHDASGLRTNLHYCNYEFSFDI